MKTNIAKHEKSLFIYMMCKFVRSYIQTEDIAKAISKVNQEINISINFVDLLYISNVCSSLTKSIKAYVNEETNTWNSDVLDHIKSNRYVVSLLKQFHSKTNYEFWIKLSKNIKYYLHSGNNKKIHDYVNGYFALRDTINEIDDWSDHISYRYEDVDPSVVKAFITAFYNSHCHEFKPKLFNKIATCAEFCVRGVQYMKTQTSGIRYKALITNLGYSFSLPSSAGYSMNNAINCNYEFNINSINTRIIYNTINFLYVNSSLLDKFISENFKCNGFSVPQLIRDTLKYALQIYVK